MLNKMRTAIRSTVPSAATETISYGMPAFRHQEVLVWFAAFSDHCSLFPTASVIEVFKKELEGFYTSKEKKAARTSQCNPATSSAIF
jgi:uncharacterized protein YdhG (YjbR/CyaY superfamily)